LQSDSESSVPASCEVVVAGHICLDIIPTIFQERIEFTPNSLVETGPAVLSTGGAVSNTGLALHKLGIATQLMGKVGEDSFGAAVREIIAGYDPGLNAGMSVARGEATSFTIIISAPGQDRMFLHCPGCNNTFGADDIDYAVLQRAGLFHFGYPPVMRRVIERDGRGLVEIFRRAKEKGVTTSLDMCMPDPKGFSGSVDWPSILEAVLPYVDIYLPSLDETLFMLAPRGGPEPAKSLAGPGAPSLLADVGAKLLAMGPSIVGLKLGEMGLYLRTAGENKLRRLGRARPEGLLPWADREMWSPCFRVKVVGTTGSGDATIAGFLAAYLRGRAPEECVTVACAVGACNVEAADALGGLLTWDQTLERMSAGWSRSDLVIGHKGWHRCPRTGTLLGPHDRGPC
jgi:sugar/nucleoside kinase (ribokinase family)